MGGMLENKVVIVGGAGGIGDELARRYAAEGAAVVLGDLDGGRARSVAQEIVDAGGRAVGTDFDGGEDASIAAIVALAMSSFGALHGFHANYCYFGDSRANLGLDIDIDMFDEMMRVNIRGYLLCARHSLKPMIASGGGAFVFTSSGEGNRPSGSRFGYSIAKAGIQALARNIANRYGGDGIRANVIAPGLILHPKMVEGMPADMEARVRETMPIKSRFGNPADIAAMGAFLLSDNAGYVTGQVIAIDGGSTMQA